MMRAKLIILCTILAAPTAHAQVSVEVAKITCQQYLAFSIADPRDVNIWLSGYYHGCKGSTSVEPQEFKENVKKLKTACFDKCRLAGDAGH